MAFPRRVELAGHLELQPLGNELRIDGQPLVEVLDALLRPAVDDLTGERHYGPVRITIALDAG